MLGCKHTDVEISLPSLTRTNAGFDGREKASSKEP